MSPPDRYRMPTDERERGQLGEVLAESFAFPVSKVPGWFASAGHENLRVLQREGEVIGGLVLVPMAQFWGGRPVRLGGFAGVGIAPHARGGGTATRMMQEGLRELRAAGFPLAGLYPATEGLYRRVGFEQAGARYELRGRLSNLPRTSRALPMRRFRPEDLPAVQRLYTEHARGLPGYLDRGPYAWSRIQVLRGEPARGFVVEEDGAVAGYVFTLQASRGLHMDLTITDWCARTPAAWQRLVAFLRDHDSIGDEVAWYGTDTDPVLLLCEEQHFKSTVTYWWMLRLLDVPAALTQRGYPPHAAGALDLEVADDLFLENAGRFVLEVHGGEARVRAGGSGALKCDVRTLAALYSGHRSASQLASVGRVEATAGARELADTLFAGRTPAMVDMY